MLLALPGFENLSIIKQACAQILHAKICGVVIHTHQEHEQDGLPQENWWTKHEPPIEHHLVHWPKCSWLSEKWVWSSIAPRDSGCMAIWKGQNHRSGQILQQLAQDEGERVRDLGGYPTIMGRWLVMAFLTASRTSWHSGYPDWAQLTTVSPRMTPPYSQGGERKQLRSVTSELRELEAEGRSGCRH